jgi:hypothetical protein
LESGVLLLRQDLEQVGWVFAEKVDDDDVAVYRIRAESVRGEET